MKRPIRIWTLAAALAIPPAFAAHIPSHPADSKAADAVYAEGEVRKIDKETGKITLRHGPIANLEMSAMTMVFRVGDATLLERVKEGDKVRFRAEKVQGVFTVTEIHPPK